MLLVCALMGEQTHNFGVLGWATRTGLCTVFFRTCQTFPKFPVSFSRMGWVVLHVPIGHVCEMTVIKGRLMFTEVLLWARDSMMHLTYAISLHSQNIQRRWYNCSHFRDEKDEATKLLNGRAQLIHLFHFNVSQLAWNMHLYLEEIPQRSAMGVTEIFSWHNGRVLGIVPLSLTWLSDVHFPLCECGEQDI